MIQKLIVSLHSQSYKVFRKKKGLMSEIGRSLTSAPYRELFLNKGKVATKRNVQFDIIQLTFIPNWVEPAVVSQL